MNKFNVIKKIRKKLKANQKSVGSWIQIPNSSLAEIIGQMGFEWVAVDMEHGSISINELPDIFRALELGNTLPIVRLAQGKEKDCKQALDAGASGIIVPMVNDAEELKKIIRYCKWPPAGNRGVAFSRANIFGHKFEDYKKEAQAPLIVAMIENNSALENLEKILSVKGLDAILIGPYDLSASMGIVGEFSNPIFTSAINKILRLSKKLKISAGIHIVEPSELDVKKSLKQGFRFIACAMDTVMIRNSAKNYLSLFEE